MELIWGHEVKFWFERGGSVGRVTFWINWFNWFDKFCKIFVKFKSGIEVFTGRVGNGANVGTAGRGGSVWLLI